MRKVLLPALVCLAMLAGVAPASAWIRGFSDPNDSPGRMDVKRTWMRVYVANDGRRHVAFGIATYERWRATLDPRATFKIDSHGGPRTDYKLGTFYDGASAGWFCSFTNRKGTIVPDFTCGHSRRNDEGYDTGPSRLLVLRFPFRLIDRTKPIRWHVTTGWRDDPGDEVAIDHAPRSGWGR